MIEQVWDNKGYKVRSVWLPASECENISPVFQVYGVCFTKDGKVLIIRNPLDKGSFTPWYLPGGTPEEGETSEETLIREVDEEADVDISNLELLGAFEVFFPNNPNKKKGDHYYQLRYSAIIKRIKEQTLDPHSNKMVELKYISPDEFTNYVQWGDLSKVLIEEALSKFADYQP